MLIRPATLVDLDACLALNADSQTDHVWQMEQRRNAQGMVIRFQPVRLPRVMYVTYPRQREDLHACWEDGSTILVATDRPTVEQPENGVSENLPDHVKGSPAAVFGYCQLDAFPWQQAGWLTHLIVGRPFRRRGIGTGLLKASVAWARSQGFSRLMIAVQTKNYPAISFCEKHGFSFCGFNDHYFSNMDIALFFMRKI
jgi:GNAT superfamily N-acetyltransferase